jgi:bifunctional enzyme CysN/CysC
MSHRSDLIASDIHAYLHQQEHKELLRFITCGSVDDGKSTLIGRLLFESQLLFEDQLKALEQDSKKWGTQGDAIDFALLVDGLSAEREQGITIDVAYRFFSTEKRKFIVADTPGHEQYTRNMATGASTADVAIILIDARKGVLTQTCRHTFITHLLGIKRILVAVNKMDLVDYDQNVFNSIQESYLNFIQQLGNKEVTIIPISAFKGDNITNTSANMAWFHGPTLMQFLETVPLLNDQHQDGHFRLPIQWVNRANADFRGFTGTIASGSISVGDMIKVQPSGKEAKISSISLFDRQLPSAVAGDAITITLDREIDISRGDLLTKPSQEAEIADQFEVALIWMHEEHAYPGRPYWLKIHHQWLNCQITAIKYQINPNTLEHLAASHLELNSIAFCTIKLDRAIPFDAYEQSRQTGSFVLVDRFSNNTVAAGMIQFALRRSHNIFFQHQDIDRQSRAAIKHQKPCVLWFTGLSGSGKSTIANLVEKKLFAEGKHTYLLDGDNIRHGLNQDLGFTPEDRVENIRRIGEVAKLMVDAGLIVLTAFISPYRAERQMAKELFQDHEFIEIFVKTPLALAEQRDPKGLYKKARSGQLQNFTGIDSPYEIPENPDLVLDTQHHSAEELADQVCAYIQQLHGR